MRIRLTTKAGVAACLVHETDIPPFQTEPEVIVWGSRVFKRAGAEQVGDGPTVTEYEEVFAYCLVTLPPEEVRRG